MEEESSFYMLWFFSIAVFNQLEKNLFIILSRRRDNQYTMTINMNCWSIFFFSKSRKFEGMKLALNSEISNTSGTSNCSLFFKSVTKQSRQKSLPGHR